jgi:aarF domain-containing kinase
LHGYIPEVVFIDIGLTNTLNSIDRGYSLDLKFDGYQSGKFMVERCRISCLVIDEETFMRKMRNLLAWPHQDFGRLVRSVEGHQVVTRRDGSRLADMVILMLSEGIGQQLDLNLDFFKGTVPIMRQPGRQTTSE